MNVRFEGNSGHDADVTRGLLLTHSGHCVPGRALAQNVRLPLNAAGLLLDEIAKTAVIGQLKLGAAGSAQPSCHDTGRQLSPCRIRRARSAVLQLQTEPSLTGSPAGGVTMILACSMVSRSSQAASSSPVPDTYRSTWGLL